MPNARLYIEKRYNDDRHRLLLSHGRILLTWNGACWVEVEDAAMRAALYEYLEHAVYMDPKGNPSRFKPTRSKIADLIEAVHAVTFVSRDQALPSWLAEATWPADEAIACANGILHVPSRHLFPSDPRLFVQHATPFDFDADAPPPQRWLRFLKEVFPDDQEAADALREWFGYLLSGDTRQQKILLVIGPPRSGKGTVLRILKALIGERYVAAPPLSALSTNFGLQPLIGKPLALVSDARMSGAQSVIIERLLTISGEDTITVDRKNREAWTGKLPTRIVMATNELPKLRDPSGALPKRFIVLSTPVSFYGREDTDLTDDLLTELPGILNWALDGLDRVRATGRLSVPRSGADHARELAMLASPIQSFIQERCVLDPNSTTTKDDLFNAWTMWCTGKGLPHGDAATFGRDLHAAAPLIRDVRPTNATTGRRSWAYAGIGVVIGPPSWS